MGCALSKKNVCRNCQAHYSPARRSHTMHGHHPHQKTENAHHAVDLTSPTLGSITLDPLIHNHVMKDNNNGDQHATEDNALVTNREADDKVEIAAEEEFAMWIIEAKSWSRMINDKIPKILPETPTTTLKPVHRFRSISFRMPRNSSLSSIDDQLTLGVKENGDASPKPLWMHLADNDSNSNSNDTPIVSELDPKVIATFRRTLEELSTSNFHHLKPLCDEKLAKDRALEVSFDEKNTNKIVPRGKDKLVVYFTSLRGVRKTYEDCCDVRGILKGLGVKVDERDLSMDLRFKDELKELMGEGFNVGGLPRVFVGRRYIGGAEEIRRLNEEGKLEKVVESCELVDDGHGGSGVGNCKVCEVCGDARFVPCETCGGSCKIYFDNKKFDDSKGECGFHRCPNCNENGLIKCSICCAWM